MSSDKLIRKTEEKVNSYDITSHQHKVPMSKNQSTIHHWRTIVEEQKHQIRKAQNKARSNEEEPLRLKRIISSIMNMVIGMITEKVMEGKNCIKLDGVVGRLQFTKTGAPSWRYSLLIRLVGLLSEKRRTKREYTND